MVKPRVRHSMQDDGCGSHYGETCEFGCRSGHRRLSCGCCTLGSTCFMHRDEPNGKPVFKCPTCSLEQELYLRIR